jgi:hypothetical protein
LDFVTVVFILADNLWQALHQALKQLGAVAFVTHLTLVGSFIEPLPNRNAAKPCEHQKDDKNLLHGSDSFSKAQQA